MEIFNITFNKANKCYIPGETIYCHLHIYVQKKFKAYSLTIDFRGFGHTEWTVSRSEMINARSSAAQAKYLGHEKYFTNCQYLIGAEHSSPIEIQPGTYHYDVFFTVPDTLPNSFEHESGNIRYVVEVNYNIMRGFDKTYAEIFYVTPELDLSQYIDLRNPVRSLKEISSGFSCCCLSEPLQLITFLPKRGWVPGERIPVTIEIDNNTNSRINFIKVELIEKLSFVATIPRVVKQSKKTVLHTKQLNVVVAPYQNKIFHTEIYLDPNFEWKIFEGSVLFYCDYVIHIEAIRVLSVGLSKNPAVDTKIQIGTIPIIDDVSQNGTSQRLPSYHEVASYNDPPAFESVRL